MASRPVEADRTSGLNSIQEPTGRKPNKVRPAGRPAAPLAGSPSGARPAGRPAALCPEAKWSQAGWSTLATAVGREDRKGPACTHVPPPPLSSPLPATGTRGEGTRVHTEVTAATGRAQPAPRPRSPPLGKGTAGPPCDAPGLASAPRLSPPIPRPSPRARARGGEAEEGRGTPRPGGAVRGAPVFSLSPSTRAHTPTAWRAAARRPPGDRQSPRREKSERVARTTTTPRPRRPASRSDKPLCRGLTFNRSQRGSCSATYETPTQKQVVYEWFSTRFPTNVRCVTGEGAAAFPAAPRVPGRRALRTGPRSRRAAGRAATRPEGRGRRPAGGDGGGPAIRGQPRLPRRCRIVPPGRDSDLEAFSHNPTDGSFAPLAPQPSTYTKCLNLRFLSY